MNFCPIDSLHDFGYVLVSLRDGKPVASPAASIELTTKAFIECVALVINDSV